MKPAVFLDRDGVLVEDVDLLIRLEQIKILEGVPRALAELTRAGFFLVMVTNQAVVARGLATEVEVRTINERINFLLQLGSQPPLRAMYFCPHHPNATLPVYRLACECRKPAPGMLLQAAREHSLDLQNSFFIGDRPSDVAAGQAAGCCSILVETGAHNAPPIETSAPLNPAIRPDQVFRDVPAAVEWILQRRMLGRTSANDSSTPG
jgi:D-glycero-D-manno-heptose 1,7-bisphosphate phosphatase